jgi:hypothetical protein
MNSAERKILNTTRIYTSNAEPMHSILYDIRIVPGGLCKVTLFHMHQMSLRRSITLSVKDIVCKQWFKSLVEDECMSFIKWCKKQIARNPMIDSF